MILIGHRGCFYPGYNQNTIRAFRKVADEEVPAIELDIQLCADKELVVVHNLDLEQVSTGKGQVSAIDSKSLKQLYAGDPERGHDEIPLVEEVLNFFASIEPSKRPAAHLELKGKGTGIPTGTLLNSYFESGKFRREDILVSSFNWDELRSIRTICPEIRVALLDGAIRRSHLLEKIPQGGEKYFRTIFAYGDEDYMLPRYPNLEENLRFLNEHCPDTNIRTLFAQEIKDCLSGVYYTDELLDIASEMNAVYVNLWFNSLQESFVEKAHQKGLRILVYTVNKEEDLMHMAQMGVDGIFTDFYQQSAEILSKLSIPS